MAIAVKYVGDIRLIVMIHFVTGNKYTGKGEDCETESHLFYHADRKLRRRAAMTIADPDSYF